MGRIFISAGHDLSDPGAVAFGTTEAKEMMLTRDLIVKELEAQRVEFYSVPDDLSLKRTIEWINSKAKKGDVALELHGNAFNGSARGTEAFYIAGNERRKQDAELILKALLAEVPELNLRGRVLSRGAKTDTTTPHGRLAFCRQVAVASILIELCFVDNREDLSLLQNHRDRFAKAIAKALIEWSGQKGQTPEVTQVSPINIRINNYEYEEKGILVNGNSFIPIDLVEQLEIPLVNHPEVRQIRYGGIVYVKAVDLQPFNVSVGWDSGTRTVILNRKGNGELEEIMGFGNASEVQLNTFLESQNEEALARFPLLPKVYIEEAQIEGVNYDIAFCQMCLETNFLRFGGQVKPEQNNFCGLGAVDGGAAGAFFPDMRTGIKAHIQHLKAYASTDPINKMPIVDPRFHLVRRGIAPLVKGLTGRWASDRLYDQKIMALVRRLHGIV
ncbi:N-acetylmuramoyl-L-alanine amidase [Aerosakkonemataceae cyanobacterium BLCC-F154]|uniref:N-acetylmuramoyl-L-alanine amidase n=1 Tax=Floridaenema fluviatile BLCC-F154 TaxID=3153640 RepID=A0ABV4Y536_9CYAN